MNIRVIVFVAFVTSISSLLGQVPTGPEISWQECYGGIGNDYFTDAIITQDNGILAAIRPLSDDGDLEGLTVEESSGWVIKYHEDMSIQWQSILVIQIALEPFIN
ncbi:MAG: hypothetical protein R2767_04300 [Chitinophagales bacterium]